MNTYTLIAVTYLAGIIISLFVLRYFISCQPLDSEDVLIVSVLWWALASFAGYVWLVTLWEKVAGARPKNRKEGTR